MQYWEFQHFLVWCAQSVELHYGTIAITYLSRRVERLSRGKSHVRIAELLFGSPATSLSATNVLSAGAVQY